MTIPFDIQGYVENAAAAVGLRVTADQRPGVIAAFSVLIEAANSIQSFYLPVDEEPAPTFTPGEKPI
jgi:hypothetical protein